MLCLLRSTTFVGGARGDYIGKEVVRVTTGSYATSTHGRGGLASAYAGVIGYGGVTFYARAFGELSGSGFVSCWVYVFSY